MNLLCLLAGENGWKWMTQIPAYRRFARNYDKIVVVGTAECKYLVQDFAEFEESECGQDCDRWLVNGKSPAFTVRVKNKYPDYRKIVPNKEVCNDWPRKYVTYGRYEPDLAYDVIFHARACRKYGQGKLNYSPYKLHQVWKALGRPKAASIGTVADHVEGTEDLRNIPMKKLCNVLASSRVTVGTSSAPLHLSMLCKTPAVVLTYDKWLKSIKGTNKDRYTKLWNPFKIKCMVLDKDDWHPPVDIVAKAVMEYL